MIFKALLKQTGEGCDYTIACGYKIIDIKADSKTEALKQLYSKIREDYSSFEVLLESCELYEIQEIHSINLEEWYNTIEKEELEVDSNIQEEIEYAKFLELKEKFEKK